MPEHAGFLHFVHDEEDGLPDTAAIRRLSAIRHPLSSGMRTAIHDTAGAAGVAAATRAAALIRAALAARGEARIVVATGASQFDMLARLVTEPGIDWSRVTAFHLDEYVGIGREHPASFRRYLRERFASKLPLRAFHYVEGDAPDAAGECRRLGALLDQGPIDLICLGIGENGHLAFNDPPADFAATDAYLVVALDDACRRQQLGEGWFPSFDAVPSRAISMSVRRILSGRALVCTVPDRRKAEAVRGALEGPLTPTCPASILRQHAECDLFLDRASASLLTKSAVAR
jgi:glucosamine-6-phosphate deaminase